ncbi:hypothetical protein [Helicovermis profundi]|uniref:GAF domain-containing protein n=1 Tax=Helicovermis profundi TaxID=3065157 RepID=A0AAU9E215_9FIRM|nr:hypothetical protein HLPR_09520 [Clostridia bacterium S502]
MDKNIKKVLTTIDFFSQILSFEQIISYGYEFFHSTLNLDKSLLYVKYSNKYLMKKSIGYTNYISEYDYSMKLKSIATLYGRIMYKDFDKYFEENFYKHYNTEVIIPIIVRDELIGFIISNGFKDKNNVHISKEYNEGMKNLLNLALTIALDTDKNTKLKKELDKKIFNLFFVNQSTKMIMAELDLSKLYSLCIDIIRELTSSSITSFGLYDELRKKIVIKGYSDIVNFKKYYSEIDLISKNATNLKIIYNLDTDRDELSKIFVDVSEFDRLSAKYVILLIKNDILGFVTVGEPVNGKKYEDDTLVQIESMAKSIYISITNALYFNKIAFQKEIIEKQLNDIKNLNRMVKNINSCSDMNELCEIAIETINIGYDVSKAFILVNVGNQFNVVSKIGYEKNTKIIVNDEFISLNTEESYVEYDNTKYEDFFDISCGGNRPDSNCLLISPIKINSFDIFNNNIYGYIVVTETYSLLNNNQMIIVDSISNSIAPLLKQFLTVNQIKKTMVEDSKIKFLKTLDNYFDSKNNYFMDFKLYYKVILSKPFEKTNLDMYSNYEFWYFDNTVLFLNYNDEEIDENLFDGCVSGDDLEEIKENLSIEIAFIINE